MKLIFYFLLMSGIIPAQTNLIPNGSFEDHVACPYDFSFGVDELSKATGWHSVGPSPDYFHTCATATNVGIPNNFFGAQMPFQGNAYAGMYSYYAHPTDSNIRETIGAKLTTTLTIGQKYYVKMNVSLGEGYSTSGAAIDKFGLRFTTIRHNDTILSPINNFAHLSSPIHLADTINWMTLFTSFTADSAYKYVEIGNFFDDAHTSVQILKPNQGVAYYFVDAVCLSTDSMYTLNSDGTTTGLGKEITRIPFTISPNPTNGMLTIINNLQGNSNFSIIDVTGKEVHTFSTEKSISETIDISFLSSGLYLLKHKESSKSILFVKE